MQSRLELARIYLDRRPSAAARILETVAPADTTALIEGLSAHITGNLLSAMPSYYAASCMTGLSTEYLVRVLQHLSTQRGAALIRVLPVVRQNSVLAKLSAYHSRALRFLLSYSNNLVGAWVDPNAFTIRPELTVAEVRQRLELVDIKNSHRLFIVDEKHHLVSSVTIAALLQAQDQLAVHQLAEPSPKYLHARTSLNVAEQHGSWRQYIEMPVIGRANEFIGVITYQDICRALQGIRKGHSQVQGKDEEIFHGLTDIYHAGLHGAWLTWMDLLSIPVEDRGVNNEYEDGYHRGT